MNGKSIFFILLPFFILFLGCKKDCAIPNDPSCKNYDPCWDTPPTSASFSMWEEMPEDTFEVSKSIFANRNLLLIADQDHENYRWKIGTDPQERTGKSTIVFFGGPYEDIKITLIVSDVPNTNCNPGDDGRDTASKTIRVHDFENLPIWGSYTGIDLDRPNDPFTIVLQAETLQFIRHATIRNLPEGCPLAWNLSVGSGGFSKELGSGAREGCYNISGVGKLNAAQDSIRIEYLQNDPVLANQSPPVFKKIEKTFIGKKL